MMLVSRHRSHFSKVTIFLLVSWSWNCHGLSKWPFENGNGLLKGYHNGAFKITNLLKALSADDEPETYLDIYNDVPELDSDEIGDDLQTSFPVKSAYSQLWEGVNTQNNKDETFGNKKVLFKRNLNSICQKGNVFGSWLVRLCNDRRSVK